MKTFTDFIVEAVGSGFAQMSDADFERWTKANPAAAEKARQVRSKFKQTYNQAQQARATQSQPKQGFGDRVKQAWDATTQRRQQAPASSTALATKPKASGFGIPRPTAGQAAVGALNVGLGALDYKQRRDAGQTRVQAGSGAASSAAGGQAGWITGAKLGAALPIPHPVAKGAAVIGLGVAGSMLGSSGASALSDKLTGVTKPSEREKLNRQAINKGQGLSGLARANQTVDTRASRQVAAKAKTYGASQGSALTGLGGPAKVNKQAGTLTTKGKTVKLASTQLVRDPKTGQQRVGDLAYKGGKAVYLARPSVASRNTGLAANIGRALNLGSFSKAAEQQAAKQEYRTELKNTQAYQRGLGISSANAKKMNLPGR